MPTYGTRRIPFDWRSFITPGVKLLVLVCVGAFLAQTLLQILVSPDFEYHRFKQIFGAVLSFTTCATRSPTGSTNATANGSRSTSTNTEKSRPRDRTIGSTRSWRLEVRH